MYDGSGPDSIDRAERRADFASWASRQGNDRAGLDELLLAAADWDFRGRPLCNDLRAVAYCVDEHTAANRFRVETLSCLSRAERLRAERATPCIDPIINWTRTQAAIHK